MISAHQEEINFTWDEGDIDDDDDDEDDDNDDDDDNDNTDDAGHGYHKRSQ